MITHSSWVPLAARAWIGDGDTGALVAADGTIDWWCPGRLDGPATFSALLDPGGAAIRVGPAHPGRGHRRRLPPAVQSYRTDTNVGTLQLVARDRQVEVTDFMPWAGRGEIPPGRIVRIATALAGPVDVEVEVRPGAAFAAPRRTYAWSEGLAWSDPGRGTGTMVRTGFPLLAAGRDRPVWRGARRLETGERLVVTIDRIDDDRHQPLSADAAMGLLTDTTVAWRSWVARLTYGGSYAGAVRRSVLAVRALTATAGAPSAAGTTSLPRRAGGERTADDRNVRWRDAATASAVLARCGLAEDAMAAEQWLRYAAEGTALPWSAVLDRSGEPVREQVELALPGWRSSEPVVTGLAPAGLDLDLYGDVVAAVSSSTTAGPGPAGPGPLVGAWPALVGAADWLADHWGDPDVGTWHLGGPPRQLVASRLQAWAALDRMARMAWAANPLDLDAAGWRQAALEIVRWVERNGLAADGGLRLDPAPADHADAALLRVAWRGPWPAHHPIVTRTLTRTLDRLATGATLHRYPAEVDDGRPGADSPDLLASFWAVRALAESGRWEEAHERMELLVAYGGRLGLLSEAVDPLSGELLGNLPSSAVHLALVDAALALEPGPP